MSCALVRVEELTFTYQNEAGVVHHHGRWWVPADPLRRFIIADCHDSLATGHPGKNKTVELILRSFSWKGITSDVTSYNKQCLTCSLSKPSHFAKVGFLVSP